MNSKKFIIATFVCTVFFLLLTALPVIIVDPFFHYHKPLKNLSYFFYNQRYVTDGIISHFDYDAIITGTSMTDNFKKSEMDSVFGVNSIKVPNDGGSFKEINDTVAKAVKKNKDLKIVVRGLDLVNFYSHKDDMNFEADNYPEYLYDNNIFNDVYYFLNKEVLFTSVGKEVFLHTYFGRPPTNFDDYSAWYTLYGFTRQEVLDRYERPAQSPMASFEQVDKEKVYGNTMQNIVQLAKDNPDVEFYYFYTPYSIVYFDREYREGRLVKNIDSAEYAAELILQQENIKLYSFFDNHDLICGENNYKDLIHYSEKVNSDILKWMKNGEYRLTKENYRQHFDSMREFYLNYDYESIFN